MTIRYEYREGSGYSQAIEADTMASAIQAGQALLDGGDYSDFSGTVTATVLEIEISTDDLMDDEVLTDVIVSRSICI